MNKPEYCRDCGGDLNYSLNGVLQAICYECAHPRRHRRNPSSSVSDYRARAFWEACAVTLLQAGEPARDAAYKADGMLIAWRERFNQDVSTDSKPSPTKTEEPNA